MRALAVVDRPATQRHSARWLHGEAEDRVRLAHRAYSALADQVHADWLAGTRTPGQFTATPRPAPRGHPDLVNAVETALGDVAVAVNR